MSMVSNFPFCGLEKKDASTPGGENNAFYFWGDYPFKL